MISNGKTLKRIYLTEKQDIHFKAGMTFSKMEIPASPTSMASGCSDSSAESRESPTQNEDKLPIHNTGHSQQTSQKGGTSESKKSSASLTVRELLQFAIRKSVTENEPGREQLDGRKRTHSNEINPFEEVQKKQRKEKLKFVETGVQDLKLEDEKT